MRSKTLSQSPGFPAGGRGGPSDTRACRREREPTPVRREGQCHEGGNAERARQTPPRYRRRRRDRGRAAGAAVAAKSGALEPRSPPGPGRPASVMSAALQALLQRCLGFDAGQNQPMPQKPLQAGGAVPVVECCGAAGPDDAIATLSVLSAGDGAGGIGTPAGAEIRLAREQWRGWCRRCPAAHQRHVVIAASQRPARRGSPRRRRNPAISRASSAVALEDQAPTRAGRQGQVARQELEGVAEHPAREMDRREMFAVLLRLPSADYARRRGGCCFRRQRFFVFRHAALEVTRIRSRVSARSHHMSTLSRRWRSACRSSPRAPAQSPCCARSNPRLCTRHPADAGVQRARAR